MGEFKHLFVKLCRNLLSGVVVFCCMAKEDFYS